ncbi:MAG: cysteine--tRNA ligase [Deltaproteobacteria bacterium]|nr:cysteine--tRNA ligase [Deltaproteobacteria bacterium]
MIRLHDTASRRKEIFRPLREGRVGIYTCGPTLHAFAHVGLIRRLLAVDVLKKLLIHDGYQVRHIVNLTDVDDKTIAESARRGVRLEELTGEYAAGFFEDMASLRMFPADHYPRATEHVDEMIDTTRRLIERGVAYEMQRSVYFALDKLPAYGRLSRVDRSKVRPGATVDLDYYEKEHPGDFTLMRRSDLAELRRRITWRTEWGQVRPGWHVECAAMAGKYLGIPFDVHTSGADLLFPHNENESAICEALHGVPMARYWLHTGMVMRKGRKMSRSAGTALTLRDLLGRGYTGSEVRWFLMRTHYRRPVDFSFDGLDASRRELTKLEALLRNLRQVQARGPAHKDVDQVVEAADNGFWSALRDDLNVPSACTRLFKLTRELNARLAKPGFSRADAELGLDALWRWDRVLSVLDFEAGDVPDKTVDALLAERDAARQAGDYARADAIRRELAAMGLAVEDTPAGSRVKRV